MISAVTPTVTPSIEMSDVLAIDACLRRASRYRVATYSSKGSAIGSRVPSPAYSRGFGRSSGKRMTSRMDWLPVRSMTSRSIPSPSPPVGGRPCSSARR